VADLQASQGNRLLDRISHMLKERFGIAHTTFQLEAEACTLEQACALNSKEPTTVPQPR
jgi:hypothetical protein